MERRATCPVVSHQRPVLRLADHIVVLKDERVEAEGKLDDLLRDCEEMWRLWEGHIEAEESGVASVAKVTGL